MGKYNLTEKKEKNAAYRSLVRAELVDELYEKILKVFVVDKKYRDPSYSAKKLDRRVEYQTRVTSVPWSISASIRITPAWSMSTASKTPSIS